MRQTGQLPGDLLVVCMYACMRINVYACAFCCVYVRDVLCTGHSENPHGTIIQKTKTHSLMNIENLCDHY